MGCFSGICYMEVAVTHVTSSRIRALAITGIGALWITTLFGCADVITYSRDAQREGIKLYRQGDYADAAGAFRNALRQNPRDYQSYYYLGASYEAMTQYQQAIQAYRQGRAAQALSLSGKEDDDFRLRLVNGLASAIAKSDTRDVETDAAAQRANSGQDPSDWFVLAKVYTYRGDADSAIDAYNRACLIEPNNFVYAKEYGLYMEKIGQPRKAEAPLRRAYSLDSSDDQVVMALRRIGVVPGPSLKDESALAKPAIPKGPIPEMRIGGNDTSPAAPGEPMPRD